MSEHIYYRNAAGNHLRNEKGSTTTTLLLVLLLVIAAGGYLYYFTDLIRPAAKEAPKLQSAQNQVKQPLPPRPAQPGEAVAPIQGEAVKPATSPSPTPPVPVAGQKPVPPVASAAAPAAKPESAKIAKVQPQPSPVPAAVPPKAPSAQPKPAAAPVTPAKKEVAQQKLAAAPTAPAKKETASAKPVPKQETVKRKGGVYTILVGDFVPDKTLQTVQAKLKKSGIRPVRNKVITTAEPMNRLFVAELNDQDSAEAELQKLKKITTDAFLVADNGKYLLYAGSYFSEGRKQSELQRLSAKGIKAVVKQTRIPIKVTRITVGSYATTDEAASASKQFKKMGISPKIIKIGS